jgi:hypothetical protein
MDLILLLIGIAVIGFLVYALVTVIPMPPIFKTVIIVVASLALLGLLIARFSGLVPNVLR